MSFASFYARDDDDGDRNSTRSSTYGAKTEQTCDSWEQWLNEKFQIPDRNSTIRTEIRAGFVTFATMVYITVVNAHILNLTYGGGGNKATDHMGIQGIVTATAVSAAVGSFFVGYWGNLPFGLAPGMGLNAYFTYGVCSLETGLTWRDGLTCSFMTGVLFLLMTLCGLCSFLQAHTPIAIKKAITMGLGLFQALIAFDAMKLVVKGTRTPLMLGDVLSPTCLLPFVAMLLICLLIVFKIKASMIIGIFAVTLYAWMTELTPYPETWISAPSMGNTFLQLDFAGYVAKSAQTIPVTLVMLFIVVLDTTGVQYAIANQADLLQPDGSLENSKVAFAGASIATLVGACLGTSPVIIHTESFAGVEDGARTGLSAITVSLCFLASLPFAGIVMAVPEFATAAPLALVGMFMMSSAKYINWDNIPESFPAFLIATLIPFTYSIDTGIIAGMGAYAVLNAGSVASKLLVGGDSYGSVPSPLHEASPQIVVEVPPSPFYNKRKGSVLANTGAQLGFTLEGLQHLSLSRLSTLPLSLPEAEALRGGSWTSINDGSRSSGGTENVPTTRYGAL